MKIWLDDQRGPSRWEGGLDPSEWTWLETIAEVIDAIEAGGVTHVHLDYDLGWTDQGHTGMDVCDFLFVNKERLLHEGKMPELNVHSAHVTNAGKLWKAIRQIEE